MWGGNPWLSTLWASCNSPALEETPEAADATEAAQVETFRSYLGGNIQTLPQVDWWYDSYVRQTRDANRLTTLDDALLAKLRGANKANPNGVCGDTMLFVRSEYEKYMPQLQTSEGLVPGMVLWEEDSWLNNLTGLKVSQSNHAAVVMMPEALGEASQIFEYDRATNKLDRHVTNSVAEEADILSWRVYDLYKDAEPITLGEWWERQDELGGRITISKSPL